MNQRGEFKLLDQSYHSNLLDAAPRNIAAAKGVEVTLAPTRSRVKRVRIKLDRLVHLSHFMGETGRIVLRSHFQRALGESDPVLIVDYLGEHVDIAYVRWLVAPDSEPAAELTGDRGEAIQQWFRDRAQVIQKTSRKGAQRRAALFFLELDRITSPELIRFTLKNEMSEQEIRSWFQCLKSLGGMLGRRMLWRVKDRPELVERAQCDAHEVERVSNVFMTVFRKLSRELSDKPVKPGRVLSAFMRFAAGDLAFRDTYPHSNGRPNGALFFLFGEFAFVAAGTPHQHSRVWKSLLGPLVRTQAIYAQAYGPPRRFTEFGKRGCTGMARAERRLLIRDWNRDLDWEREFNTNVLNTFVRRW